MTDAYISWIHCNTCFAITSEDQAFYLGSCKHVFCKSCIQTQVIANGNKCPYCKRQVRHKPIDDSLDANLKAALDPNPQKALDVAVKNFELNVQQMSHLHHGLDKCEKQILELDAMEKKLDEELKATQSNIRKVLAQNKLLAALIEEEDKKRFKPKSPYRMFLQPYAKKPPAGNFPLAGAPKKVSAAKQIIFNHI